jgi:hypothetical protein
MAELLVAVDGAGLPGEALPLYMSSSGQAEPLLVPAIPVPCLGRGVAKGVQLSLLPFLHVQFLCR